VRDEVLGAGSEFAAGLDNGLNGINSLCRLPPLPACNASPTCRSTLLIRWPVGRRPCCRPPMPSRRPCAPLPKRWPLSGIETGSSVRVRQGNGEAMLIARLDDKVPLGCVRVAAAHPTTAMLGEMFGEITVERA
jgi:NADH-quinone oxidoreductase subunit G